jgi:hypothetical protein
MRIIYLRNVPDEVADRLERLADAEGVSLNALAVRELTVLSRRADNPALLGVLPDLQIDPGTLVHALDAERSKR